MVQPSQQHVVPYVKRVELGLGKRGLWKLATFWAGIQGVPRRKRAVNGTPFESLHTTLRKTVGVLNPRLIWGILNLWMNYRARIEVNYLISYRFVLSQKTFSMRFKISHRELTNLSSYVNCNKYLQQACFEENITPKVFKYSEIWILVNTMLNTNMYLQACMYTDVF